MKKKLTALLLALVMVFSCFSYTYADTNQNEKKVNKEKEYSYMYNELPITSNVKLTEEELEVLYNNVMSNFSDSDAVVTPSYVPIEDPGSILVTGPVYRYCNNENAREVAEALAAYLISKLPTKSTNNLFANWLIVKVTNLANSIKDTYIGTWVTKSWSSYDNMYKYYTTLIHYTDATYTTKISVQYYYNGLYGY